MRLRVLAALCAASVVSVTSFGQQQPPPVPPADANGPNANGPGANGANLADPAGKPSAGASAASPAVKPAAPPRSPQLLGEDGNPVAGVRVMKADVKAVVRGPLAEAVMVLTFRNETDRVLGGELTFPLPDGATVAGYGLDVNGVLVDGVAVEKQQARVIYEKEMNKSVDPGLVEHVVGNNFRTRLYPIPAKGTRTIKVTYVADLVPADGGKGATLTLPMNLGENLEALDLTVAVEGATEPPTVRGGSYTSRAFNGTRGGFYLQESLREAKAVDALTVSLPEVPATSAVVQRQVREPGTVEEMETVVKSNPPAAGRPGVAEHYFVLTDSPRAPIDQLLPSATKNHRVMVVWDASLSRASIDKSRELKLLERSLAQLGHPSVDVALLRNDVEVTPFFAAGPDVTAKVLALLKGVTYDGGTNLGALSIPRRALGNPTLPNSGGSPPDYDLALMFTDGLSTVGKDAPAKVEIPVYAMSADPSANHAALRAICQQSGGVYLNLNRETDEAAVAAIGRPPFAVVGVECEPARVADVTPGVGSPVGGRVTVAGRLLAPEATVTLVYGFGKTETSRRTFTLKQADATDGTLVPRFWAQQRAAEMALAGVGQRDELVTLGRKFNLVTPATSLLVLETVEQYVQYGVVPPKSRPDVYKDFQAKIETRKVQEAATKEQKVQQVLGMWNARKAWWAAEYKYPADLKVNPAANKPHDAADALLLPAARTATSELGVVSNATSAAAPHPARPAAAPATPPAAPPPAPAPLPPSPPAEAAAADAAPAVTRGAGAGRPISAAAPAARPPAAEAAAAPSTPVPGSMGRPAAAAKPARPEPAAGPAAHDPQGLSPLAVDRQRALATDDLRRDVQNQPISNPRGRVSADRRGFAGNGDLDGASRDWGERRLKDAEQRARGDFPVPDAAGGIALQTWDPNTPYLTAMKAVAADKAYDAYLGQRDKYAKSPAFYFDCADYLVRAGQKAAGVRVLTDVVELKLEDARLIRVAAHRLNQIGQTDLAIDLFERVLKLRPEEPQSHRDLALALAARADANPGDTGRSAADYARALDLLNKVVTSNWDRFQEIEVIALMEANEIVAKVQRTPSLGSVPIPLDARLRQLLDCDVRVVMTWDADQTDIDLWVEEPSGEVCLYSHNRTQIGGAMSRDFTQGYGPEEYLLRKRMPGAYTVKANFYGSRQQELTGPCTVQATVITDFGRPTEKRQHLTLRLANRSETVTVGTVTLK
jgi:Ca-activated chloride channel family protein